MAKRYDVFTMRKYQDNGQEKTAWTRVGVGFQNKDGSYNIRLDALPVSGELHMREPDAKDESDRAPADRADDRRPPPERRYDTRR